MHSSALSCMGCGLSTTALPRTRSSPVAALWRSNDAPLNSEQITVRNAILEAKEDLFQLDTEIARIEAVLLELKRQRSELNHFVVGHQAILSPIRRLPTEILSKIFFCCIEPEPKLLDVRRGPWVLGMICGRWRAVALSTPRLWCSFYIDLGIPSHKSMSVALFLAETYLQRSGRYPLALSIDSFRSWASHPILDIIVSHSHHWQSIRFHLNIPMLRSLNRVQGRVPLLQKLTIAGAKIQVRPDDEPFPLLKAFESAPLLHDVTVIGYRDVLSSLPLPWPQITRYRGDLWQSTEVLEVLPKIPNIVEFALGLKPIEGDTPSSGLNTVLKLSKLRQLSLTGDRSGNPSALLDRLTLPALEEIQIKGPYYDGHLSNRLISLLSRSLCLLKQLALDANMPGAGIICLLRETPLLVKLDLSGDSTTITDELLAELRYRPEGPLCLTPYLHSIVFSGIFSYAKLVDMIESRFQEIGPISPLQSVQLNPRHDLQQHIYLRLQQLRRRGLSLKVKENRKWGE